ncbi:MAG: ABC transporter ATP-binding protein [Lachnospiraceae bacterium]|nr:ABC transporter ATP-binding protein [Lachnospiraceae bacterium]
MSIVLNNIKKVYPGNKKAVIEHLNLNIEEGSFTVLLGPSGCGKTTLLRMIAGLEEVTDGEIFVDDKNITHMEPGDRNLAMVFQNYAIYPHMTVRGNIEFGLKNYKITKEKIKERVDSVLEITGLTEYGERMPNQLSGGQRQRVALARAISKSPKAFLMDEPLSNLDAKLRNQMRSELIQLFNQLDTTFIYVTHDQSEALTMATDIVVMRDGKIMQKGTPQEIYRNPANVFVAQFIGDPGMNVIRLKDRRFIGIKPRALSFRSSQNDRASLKATVVTREFLGVDYQYTLDIGIGKVVVRSADEIEIGTEVRLYFPEKHLFYFDEDENRCDAFELSEMEVVYRADE